MIFVNVQDGRKIKDVDADSLGELGVILGNLPIVP